MGAGRRRDFPGWRMVWALAGTETVAYGVLFYSFAVFLVPMQRDLGAGTAQLSGALTLAMAVTGAAAPAVGRWLDRHGARWLMTAGSLLGAACVVGWSQVRTLPQLYLVFTGIGLACAAVLYEPAYAVINTWFRRERRAALLTLTVVAGFASTVFLPTSQALIDGLGWRSALLVLAVPVALCAVPHALLLRRAPADLGLAPDGDAASPGPAAEPGPGPSAVPDPPAAPVDPWRDPAVRRLTLATALEMLAITAVAVHLVAHLLERGAPPPLAAAAAGALGAMSVAGRVALTALAGRLGTGPVSASLLAGQAVGVGLLFALPQPVSTVLFVLLFGAGFGVIHIARPALLGSYVPAAVFASVSGGQALAGQLGRVVAPVAAGALIGAAGYGVAFGAVAACTLAAAALILSAERAAALTPERAAPR
ncbi:MFS transporter [Geodermatophilus obscurus]|uniref:Major facilitator superfamily MFS_1 n=1 Tax=Geodermatophilus obscurus (strain ATCC 25078 / DSM 43160 / JCM 3152 / CCUG 61914 / KCC A-0152 / KCTC 9177 / NBRC 13315 / NRRL B-3577 / G-20) TaxID=526225 RepID=D2SD23_GEOOG|nr:major facilitator superfamily MFS_1 [Geodermatophilus obscurus DSM 43160]